MNAELFICPNTGKSLEESEDGKYLISKQSYIHYPIIDGIVDFLSIEYKSSKNWNVSDSLFKENFHVNSTIFLPFYSEKILDIKDRVLQENLLSFLPNKFNGKILEVGISVNPTTLSKYQQMSSCVKVFLDDSSDVIQSAKENFKKQNVINANFVRANLNKIPIKSNSIDAMMSFHGGDLLRRNPAAFTELLRVLKSGGLFCACFSISDLEVLSKIATANYYINKNWFFHHFYSVDKIYEVLELFFDIKSLEIKESKIYFCGINTFEQNVI